MRLTTFQKSILHLRTFCPGVFFCKNCGRINKEDFTYKILLSSDYDDHNPPHFHAEYNGNKAIIEIDTARCIKGALPSRQLKLILAWCVLHQDELMQNWELSKDGKPLNRINPLV